MAAKIQQTLTVRFGGIGCNASYGGVETGGSQGQSLSGQQGNLEARLGNLIRVCLKRKTRTREGENLRDRILSLKTRGSESNPNTEEINESISK